MPFTPFHLGPAALLKAAAPQRFSFLLFAFSQVMMDLEPFYYLWTSDPPVHRAFHTVSGCLIPAALTLLLGPPARALFLYYWNGAFKTGFSLRVGFPAALLTALIGAYSHVFLDAIMHPDMRPFRPLTDANPLLGLLSVFWLHALCAAAGIAGLIFLARKR